MSTAADPRALIDRHESAMDSTRRRALGAHYTPEALARRLVRLGIDGLGRTPLRVLDPSCGAGSILVAVADELVSCGVAPREVPGRLVGFDIDADAISAAREALAVWGDRNGVSDQRFLAPPTLEVRDALAGGPAPADVELVIGNPPFASPLTDRTDAGGGESLGPYTDISARHLLAAVGLASRHAVVCMLQPQSLLAARDAAPVRALIADRADLAGMWLTDEQPFDAAVQVCAPILRVDAVRDGQLRQPAGRRVAVHWRDKAPVVAAIQPAGSWSSLLATVLGVPSLDPTGEDATRPLGEVATCTAGFRDEFYALAEAATEQTMPGAGEPDRSGGSAVPMPRLVTSGMIDPATLTWGVTPRRLGGRKVMRPVVELDRLAEASPKVARWACRRMVPKVLVASQTRVIEAALDPQGAHLPVTPVVSVEPLTCPDAADHAGAGIALEAIAGLLAAPSSSARVAAASAGTGRSTGSLRISASGLASLPVPRDGSALRRLREGWSHLESIVSTGGDPASAGRELDAALGVHDDEVVRWWAERVGSRLDHSQNPI